jgi:hypothetical protein
VCCVDWLATHAHSLYMYFMEAPMVTTPTMVPL